MADSLLSDVKVLDLSQNISGPYCTKLLADYGAEVTKVEPPSGDPCRRLGPFLGDDPHPEKSGTFFHLNTNKKGITLDITTATGKRILKELVKDADALIENFPPRVMPDLDLSYETLEKLNPRLVMTSVTFFGQSGPYRDYKATEITVLASMGRMHSIGMPDREPLKFGSTVVQCQNGTVAAAATLGALWGARLGGEGQHVDVSIMEVEIGSINQSGSYQVAISYSGESPGFRSFSRAQALLPTGPYPCKDGYVQFNASRPQWWPFFCRMLDRPDLLNDPRFAPTAPGVYNIFDMSLKDEIDAILIGWCMERTVSEVAEQAQAQGLTCTPINSMENLFNDPHFRARGFFVETEHPVMGKLVRMGPPFKVEAAPWQAGRAPLLGEHNEEIYCGRLGYTKQDLMVLRERGVI